MVRYIELDAVVAEIERRICTLIVMQRKPEMSDLQEELQSKIDCLKSLKGFINNTLEVKEVDLKEEIDKIWKPRFSLGWDDKSLLSISYKGFEVIAKHFFEIGLAVSDKAQNIWHDASEKLPTGVIVVSNGGHLHIGWSTDEGDGIEDEHGHLITKTYQKWASEKDLT